MARRVDSNPDRLLQGKGKKNKIGLFPRTLLRVHSSCSPPVPVASIFVLRGGCAAGFRRPISVMNFTENFGREFFHGSFSWFFGPAMDFFLVVFVCIFIHFGRRKKSKKNPWKNSRQKSSLKSMGPKKKSTPTPKHHEKMTHGKIHARPCKNPWAESMRARE